MHESTPSPAELGVLPDPVQLRAAAIAADALGEMPAAHVPVALRRVAVFAPSRRAKLAGMQVLATAADDPDFREHLAVQVRASHPDELKLIERVLADEETLAAAAVAVPPVDAAALLWLVRPEGWEDGLRRALETFTVQEQAQVVSRAETEARRLRERWDESVHELRAAREEHRTRVEELKRENADLRRKLGETRQRLRRAEETATQHAQEAEAARAEAASGAGEAAAEIRRLRARVGELEQAVSAARSSDRADRQAETMRARLLLDTLLDAAQGLRRELALPAGDTSPGERREAQFAGPGEDRPAGVGAVDSPADLTALLALPRTRLIVDGYNVSKTAWPTQPLAAQRDLLLSGIAGVVARHGAETTVVFDAADSTTRPTVAPPRGVRVLFSPVGVIADDVIRELVAAEPTGRPVLVVTSDLALGADVRRSGARVVESAALVAVLARG